jgi:hypothetical protein
LVPWIKIRYKAFNVLGSLWFIIVLICIKGRIGAEKGKDEQYYKAYIAFVIILCLSFLFSSIAEIVIMRN